MSIKEGMGNYVYCEFRRIEAAIFLEVSWRILITPSTTFN
jgi:hypothetical protein